MRGVSNIDVTLCRTDLIRYANRAITDNANQWLCCERRAAAIMTSIDYSSF